MPSCLALYPKTRRALTKEPYLLLHRAKKRLFIKCSILLKLNDYVPTHVVKLLAISLQKIGKHVKTRKSLF